MRTSTRLAGILRLDPAQVGLTSINLCLALILFPSAMWMPLVFEYLEVPGPARWWAMRGVLMVVGLASLALALVVLIARVTPAPSSKGAATAGAALFTLQTLVLDALIWPRYFPQ